MQATIHHQPSPEDQSPRLEQWRARLKAWAQSSRCGYLCSVLLPCLLLALEKLDDYLPQAPLFTSAPFALVAAFTALLWGIGPALLAFALGAVALAFVSPSPLLLSNAIVLGPFLLLQLIAIVIIVGLERSRRGLLRAHHELQQVNQQLSQTIQLKDYILMRAGHELRTPLTTILGRTQLFSTRLEKFGATSATLADLPNYLNQVETRSRHLHALIESLLDLSNAHLEETSSSSCRCDLGRLSREMVENQRALSARSIELICPAGAIMVPVNEQRLYQVLENLLSNAIKYSPQDSPISVQISLDQSEVTVRVHNEGASLSAEQRAHLFDPFYRTPSVEYSSIPGWGLGLAISKEIVERSGGHIRVEASEANEIAFLIILPLYRYAH